jgi:hypothetical protein
MQKGENFKTIDLEFTDNADERLKQINALAEDTLVI